MHKKIDTAILRSLIQHNRKLGIKRMLKSVGYERSAELPYIVAALKNKFGERLRYLDIGSGDSLLPTYLLGYTNWNITCLDKFAWVQQQARYSELVKTENTLNRLQIKQSNLFDFYTEEKFDIITSISVIEHFEDALDAKAMAHSASLLNYGGIYILVMSLFS